MNSPRVRGVRYRVSKLSITRNTYETLFPYTGNEDVKSCSQIDRAVSNNSPRRSISAAKIVSATMVLSFISLILLSHTCAGASVAAQSTAVIRTSTGPVQGEISSTIVKGTKYSAFKGIPYAKPPLGNLRFKPPVPVEPWTTILNATTEGNVCPQIDLFTANYTGDENCLFLNVFSPVTDLTQKPKNPKAVMVWIYGGSFKSGSSRTDLYGPDFLLENDVVVVSFNYRLGPLGFLGMNHRDATGNAALKDQNLVLKWVRDNIANFGGDPKQVTIFGQSAGGVSVDFQVLSDQSIGLFKQAISMSASALATWGFATPSDAEEAAKKLGKLLNETSSDKDTLLRTFYDASAYDLVMASEKMSTMVPMFKPTIEDPKIAGNKAFITKCSVKKYSSGDFNKVPYITGFTTKETLMFTGSIKPFIELIDLAISTAEGIGISLPSSLLVTKKALSTATSVVNGISNMALQALIDETTDLIVKYPVDNKQKTLVSNSRKPVYYYQLSFDPTITLHEKFYDVELRGAAHGDDLAYLFYMPSADLPLDPSDPISITRHRMTRMWTNFAKYGNPTPDGAKDATLNITWPESGSSGTHLDIGDNLSVGSRPINANVKLMQLIGTPTAAVRNGCPSIVGGIFNILLK